MELLGTLPIITLNNGIYEAKISPRTGGMLLSLKKNGVEVLHCPGSQEELQEAVTSYGYPLLFPPNRIEDGRFTAAGKTYQFPLNEPARNNSLHGFLHKREWMVDAYSDTSCSLLFVGDEDTAFFEYFPCYFVIYREYELTEEGLKETTRIINDGEEPMPLGLGFHTAFRVDEDTKVLVSVGQRVETTERMLPSGVVRDLNEAEIPFRTTGMDPMAFPMDDLYTVKELEIDGKPFHGAIIETREAVATYKVDEFFRHWVMWNSKQKGGFMCIEPQNWRINAPNLVETLGEAAGMDMLEAGEEVSVTTFLSVENK